MLAILEENALVQMGGGGCMNDGRQQGLQQSMVNSQVLRLNSSVAVRSSANLDQRGMYVHYYEVHIDFGTTVP